MKRIRISLFFVTLLAVAWIETSQCETLRLEGVTVTPHIQSHEMRYRKKTDFSLGARTELFIQNISESILSIKPDTNVRLRDRTAEELLDADEWAWYDFPDAWKDQPLTLTHKALTVWTFNGKHEEWGVGNGANMSIKLSGKEGDTTKFRIPIERPSISP